MVSLLLFLVELDALELELCLVLLFVGASDFAAYQHLLWMQEPGLTSSAGIVVHCCVLEGPLIALPSQAECGSTMSFHPKMAPFAICSHK